LTLLKILIQPEWAPQARRPLCFAHAVQSIATPLAVIHERQVGDQPISHNFPQMTGANIAETVIHPCNEKFSL